MPSGLSERGEPIETTPTPGPTTFALVGCGRVASHHLRALESHADRASLIAVCDTDAERLSEASRQASVPGYESLEVLLANEEPEVIVLASPSGLHPRQATMAARAGCHVMCEKPIATDLQEGRRVVEACEEAGIELFVVKQLRYNPTLRLLARALTEGRFGAIHMVDLDVFWTRPQAYYDRDAWRGSRRLDGGALLNQTSHYVDLLTWLFGAVDSVQAYTDTLARDIEVEDSAVVNLRWRSGTLGSMSVTMLTWPENLRASLTVIGSRGTAVLGGKACDKIETWRFRGESEDAHHIARVNERTREFYGDGHINYYENVLDVLQNGHTADTDGHEGLKSLEVISAAYRSDATGNRVELPL
ncbi:MAG: Gfo/Idh/MocA family protein [Persicimonas sp.]